MNYALEQGTDEKLRMLFDEVPDGHETSTHWTLRVVAVDLCGTGYPDLGLSHDYGVSEFFANHEDNTFEELGYDTGTRA